MNDLEMYAEAMRRMDELRAQLAASSARERKLREALEGFAKTAEAAAANFENRGKGGQHVSFHGDFASAPPSVIIKLQWWARLFRDALASTAPESEEGK